MCKSKREKGKRHYFLYVGEKTTTPPPSPPDDALKAVSMYIFCMMNYPIFKTINMVQLKNRRASLWKVFLQRFIFLFVLTLFWTVMLKLYGRKQYSIGMFSSQTIYLEKENKTLKTLRKIYMT